MHFCSVCSNMYYITIDKDDPNKLTYYCRNCGNVDDAMYQKSVTILSTNLKRNDRDFSSFINRYTKLDPTLPRINRVPCPNEQCASNEEGGKREILYLRYDDINMKYVYLCAVCDFVWKSDEQK